MSLKNLLISFTLAAGVAACAQTPTAHEIAPGITLPSGEDATVLVLDAAPSGPFLVHIKPHETVIDSNAATNFIRSMVYSGPHATAEAEEPHASIKLASTTAVVFVHLGADPELTRQRVHLLWLLVDKKRREISDFSTNIFGGQHKRHMFEVPCDTEMVEGTNWLKVTPKEPLIAGEFGVVLLPKEANQQPTEVYDFSVDGPEPKTSNRYTPKPEENSDTKKK